MRPPSFFVWLWLDPVTHAPRYVGCDKMHGDMMPWDWLWNEERGREGSPVREWLGTLDKPPLRDPTVGNVAMGYREAMAYAAKTRRGTAAKWIPNRSYFNTQSGGGARKACVDDRGDVYVSLREAARERGVDVAAVLWKVRHPKESGWAYLNVSDRAQVDSVTCCCQLCGNHNRKSALTTGPEFIEGKPTCGQCLRVVRTLTKKGMLIPAMLRERADEILGAKVTDRTRKRYARSAMPGMPVWLRNVAKYLESFQCN